MKILFKEIIPSLEIKVISARLNCIFLLMYLKIPKKLIEAKRIRNNNTSTGYLGSLHTVLHLKDMYKKTF